MHLKAYLEYYGISRSYFAKSIGVSVSCIDQYLLGNRRPMLEIALKIFEKTNGKVTLEELMEYYKKNHRG